MTVFANYAPWYDLVYRVTDDATEANFVGHRLRASWVAIGMVLHLGCGIDVQDFAAWSVVRKAAQL